MATKREEARAGSLLVLLDKGQRELVDRAAQISGRSSGGFLRHAGLTEATLLVRRRRRKHSRDGQVRCEICSPLRCSKA